MTTLSLKKSLPPEKLQALGVKPVPQKPVEPPAVRPPPEPQPPTETKELTRRHREHLAALALLDKMKARWPASFGTCRPLKIGVSADIIAAMQDVDRKLLNRTMRWHVRSPGYLRGVAKFGSERVDLAGAIVEPVADDHRAQAHDDLAKRKMVKAARKKVEAADKASEAPVTA